MSSASDYMVGNAPQGASYAAPLVGQQIGQQLAGMPEDYMRGRQFARQRAIQDAFPNGIPMKDGTADVDQIMSTMGRVGGGEYIQGLMPYLLQQRGAENFARGMSAGDAYLNGGGGQPAGTRNAPAASGPGNVTPRPQATSPGGPSVASPQGSQGTQPMSSAGMDNNGGGDTIRTLATAAGRGKDMTSAIGTIARTYQLNPDAPLQPDQVQRVNNFLANAVGVGANGQNSNQQPTQPPKAATEDTNLDDTNFPLGASKANLDQLQRYDTVIGNLNRGALTPGLSEQQQSQIKQRLQQLQENRNRIWDYMSEDEKALYKQQLQNAAPTNEEKNLRSASQIAAFERDKKRQEILATSRGKAAEGNVKAGEVAEKALPMTKYALTLANNPGFISGAGKPFQDTVANIAQSIGIGQNASIGQIFDKLRSETVLNGIRSMAGTGPVRVAEMKVIEQASGDRANQAEAVRAVLTMQQRAYEKQLAIKNVLRQHGDIIDDSTQADIDQIMAKPLFSKAEMDDPHALGARTFNSPQELAAAHLPPRSPWRAPNGEIRYTH